MSSPRVLVTGASGFIGGRLVPALLEQGFAVRAQRRHLRGGTATPVAAEVVLADLADDAALLAACDSVHAVVHCAGHAHAFHGGRRAARLHDEINHQAVRRLAALAAHAGVRHFVLLSSVKAMGAPGAVVADEQWLPPPTTPYGEAKRAAELAVQEVAAHSSMTFTMLRPAMVYGPGSRGNLERMLQGVAAGWFPPLPETGAVRSLVHVDDLIDAILLSLIDARARGRTFIVAHPHASSGAELYSAMRRALGLPPRRRWVSAGMLRAAASGGELLRRVTGRPVPLDREVLDRLLGPECYSSEALSRVLGWRARVDLESGLRGLVAATHGVRR